MACLNQTRHTTLALSVGAYWFGEPASTVSWRSTGFISTMILRRSMALVGCFTKFSLGVRPNSGRRLPSTTVVLVPLKLPGCCPPSRRVAVGTPRREFHAGGRKRADDFRVAETQAQSRLTDPVLFYALLTGPYVPARSVLDPGGDRSSPARGIRPMFRS